MNKDIFKDVAGLKEQKEELLNILDWYEHEEEHRKSGIVVPRGVLLVGEPGNGKSLLIRSLLWNSSIPSFVFRNDTTNIVKELNDLFAKAKGYPKAILCIDELDLLLNKEEKIVRCLQENLDGIESGDRGPLVLAACNNLDPIPFALRREGRLGKVLSIESPGEEDVRDFLSFLCRKHALDEEEYADDDDLVRACTDESYVNIQSAFNEALLRNGGKIDSEKVYDSLCLIQSGLCRRKEVPTEHVCIHEAAHCVVSSLYPQYFRIGNIRVNGQNGYYVKPAYFEDGMTYGFLLASIHVSFAGCLAEKLFFKESGPGSQSDLSKARHIAYSLINSQGYSRLWKTLPPCGDFHARSETSIKKRKNELLIEKLLRKCERETKRLVRKHRDKILLLANELKKTSFLGAKEVRQLLERNA